MKTKLTKRTRQEILLDFQSIGEQVAALLVRKQNSLTKLKFHYKDNKQYKGLVSDADYAAEKLILRYLGKKYPHIPISL